MQRVVSRTGGRRRAANQCRRGTISSHPADCTAPSRTDPARKRTAPVLQPFVSRRGSSPTLTLPLRIRVQESVMSQAFVTLKDFGTV
jgi:hypothetical protein